MCVALGLSWYPWVRCKGQLKTLSRFLFPPRAGVPLLHGSLQTHTQTNFRRAVSVQDSCTIGASRPQSDDSYTFGATRLQSDDSCTFGAPRPPGRQAAKPCWVFSILKSQRSIFPTPAIQGFLWKTKRKHHTFGLQRELRKTCLWVPSCIFGAPRLQK